MTDDSTLPQNGPQRNWLPSYANMTPAQVLEHATDLYEVLCEFHGSQIDRDAVAMLKMLAAPLPPPQARTPPKKFKLEAKCGLCNKPMHENGEECSIKLSPLQSALISVALSVNFCDHYCCGDTDWVCKVKTLAHDLLDPNQDAREELRKALAESAQQEAGARDLDFELRQAVRRFLKHDGGDWSQDYNAHEIFEARKEMLNLVLEPLRAASERGVPLAVWGGWEKNN